MGSGKHLARCRALVKSGGIYSTDVTGVVMNSSEELALFALHIGIVVIILHCSLSRSARTRVCDKIAQIFRWCSGAKDI